MAQAWTELMRSLGYTRWTEFGRGGHFAAMEQLKLHVNDVRTFARTLH